MNRTEKYYSEKFMDDFEGVDSLVEIGSQSLKVSDTNLYVTTIDKKAIWSIMKTLYISLLIVVVALVVPAVFMIQFSHNFVSQVNTLRDEMHKARILRLMEIYIHFLRIFHSILWLCLQLQ